jgi:hypothetical protein
VAVDKHLPPFGAQRGQVVENVGQYGVQVVVVVVVGDVGHAAHLDLADRARVCS